MILVTESAVKQLRSVIEGEPRTEGKGLRLSVEHGGCAGMQYGMKVDEPREGDFVVQQDGARVLVDAASGKYLAGCTLDYEDGLTGSGFRIHNPRAVRSCGCGTSFEATETPEAPAAADAGAKH